MAGKVDRKKPAIGRNINSKGKINCLIFPNFDIDGSLGLLLKSIITAERNATMQEVRIRPARLGSLYPSVVLEKTGFINVIIFAAIVRINQLTGHKK